MKIKYMEFKETKSEEENAYNIQLIKYPKEMLEMLEYIVNEVENGKILDSEDLFDIKQLIKQATEL